MAQILYFFCCCFVIFFPVDYHFFSHTAHTLEWPIREMELSMMSMDILKVRHLHHDLIMLPIRLPSSFCTICCPTTEGAWHDISNSYRHRIGCRWFNHWPWSLNSQTFSSVLQPKPRHAFNKQVSVVMFRQKV